MLNGNHFSIDFPFVLPFFVVSRSGSRRFVVTFTRSLPGGRVRYADMEDPGALGGGTLKNWMVILFTPIFWGCVKVVVVVYMDTES